MSQSTCRDPALMQFWRELQSKILGYLVRMLGNREDAKEILNDVQLAVWEEWQSGSIHAGWVWRVAKHKAIEHTRHKQRKQRPPENMRDGGIETVEIQDTAPASVGEHALFIRNLWEQVKEWLETKRHKDNKVAAVWLQEVEDLSTNEIASLLDINPDSVKVLVSRARKKLKRVFPEVVEILREGCN